MNNEVVNQPSSHPVQQTVDKLKSILQGKGVTLFALIDHSGEAEKVGMKMLPTKLLIFGNPKSGTPLMLASPRIALDLPLKILVWQDNQVPSRVMECAGVEKIKSAYNVIHLFGSKSASPPVRNPVTTPSAHNGIPTKTETVIHIRGRNA